MPDQKPQNAPVHAGALARPDWRSDGEFTAADLDLDQKYFLQRLRRHDRFTHGWGVICGLNVAPGGCGGWDLVICPGYGIGPCGEEIFLAAPLPFNLRDYLWTRPVGHRGDQLWILIEATLEPASWEPAPSTNCGCGCGGLSEAPSRFNDGVRVDVVWSEPLRYRGGFNLCSGATPLCPRCPDSCGLPLARVTLPNLDQTLTIDNSGGD
jgi:hypothetical protein